jgi:hypothetical protein
MDKVDLNPADNDNRNNSECPKLLQLKTFLQTKLLIQPKVQLIGMIEAFDQNGRSLTPTFKE